jgi:hypothetical protein
MFRRHHALAAVMVLAMPAAIGACSSDQKATPRVTFDSRVSPGSHGSDCPETGTWVSIGTFGNPGAGTKEDGSPKEPVVPVDDGGEFGQGTAGVTCAVTPEGDGFHVSATATLTATGGGAIFIDGHFTASGNQENISATFTSNERGSYVETDHKCTAIYSQPLETVAAGRVWADINCPNAELKSQNRTCNFDATFRFENCGQ